MCVNWPSLYYTYQLIHLDFSTLAGQLYLLEEIPTMCVCFYITCKCWYYWKMNLWRYVTQSFEARQYRLASLYYVQFVRIRNKTTQEWINESCTFAPSLRSSKRSEQLMALPAMKLLEWWCLWYPCSPSSLCPSSLLMAAGRLSSER